MEKKQRPYRAVCVDMIGVESGTKRFTKDGITDLPHVARWRNNLTVMSQHENLFFIASGDCIAVYQPEFPYQTLKRHPALLIQPELARPDAHGYLSHRNFRAEQHCINHLMVGELGSQEILLLATDSGNIEAYYTAAVLDAILETQRIGLNEPLADSVGLRPFFKHWVYQSAWGLDIHTEARMIAVSSNIPSRTQPRQPSQDNDVASSITVFAFALTGPPDDIDAGLEEDRDEDEAYEEDEDEDEEDDVEGDEDEDADTHDGEWFQWDISRNLERPDRSKNYKVVLRGEDGHISNIPNICFVNSSEDPHGIWLLSTDITGVMKLWQIWRGARFREWDFSNEERPIWAHASYPGWNVATLDVSIFRPVHTNADFIGADRAPIHWGYHEQGASFNLTSIARQIPENSRYHPSHADFSAGEEDSENDQVFNDNDLDEEDSVGEDEVMEDVESSGPTQLLVDGDQETFDDDVNSLVDTLSDMPLQSEYEREVHRSESEPEIDEFDVNEDEEGDDTEDEDEEERESVTEINPALEPAGNRRIEAMRSKVRPYLLPDGPIPEVAILHCSDTHIRMLKNPRARYPHIFCANVVRQALPEHILNFQLGHELQAMDRLNMLQKIPELGILLVATQAGRVAVCSLTRKDDVLGFRVDWVLPTKKQEAAGRRPNLCTLMGMAVAPIQMRRETPPASMHPADEEIIFKDGMVDDVRTTFDPNVVKLSHRPTSKEKKAQMRGAFLDLKLERRPWKRSSSERPAWQAAESCMRYRIMLTYTDLSVLTYEISRNVEISNL